MTLTSHLFAALAAIAAGAINALAGGGTLITFPTLLAIGLPSVTANVSNTLALWPGSLGGTIAQANDLKGQGRRLWITLPFAVLGGLTGGLLLLHTTDKVFSNIVPFLILSAASLLALQNPLRSWLARHRQSQSKKTISESWIILPVFLGSIYGGYFGAGLGIILLTVLGFLLKDNLTRINALKQAITFIANFTAALLFLFSGKVVWSLAFIMMIGALVGGSMGGRLAGRVKPNTLRWIVVSIGFVVGMIYMIKTYFLA
jgi:uncharacterized membrane protein YfcA